MDQPHWVELWMNVVEWTLGCSNSTTQLCAVTLGESCTEAPSRREGAFNSHCGESTFSPPPNSLSFHNPKEKLKCIPSYKTKRTFPHLNCEVEHWGVVTSLLPKNFNLFIFHLNNICNIHKPFESNAEEWKTKKKKTNYCYSAKCAISL